MTVICARRVLLALVVAASLSASGCLAKTANTYDPPLNRFEGAVLAVEARDHVSMPVPGGTVFVGSSTFAHWTSMESDLKDLAAINRGFGGSTVPEVNYYFERLVARYKPAKVVLYAGTNDIADGHSGARVARDVATFVARAHKELPAAEVYYISMSMPPSRVQWARQYSEGNRLIEALAKHDPRMHYIDVTGVMFDERGLLHKDYFSEDNLHMNRAGYQAWIPLIRSALTGTESKEQR